MKKIILLSAVLFSIGICTAQSTLPTNIMTLNGTWDLYENSSGTVGISPEQSMNIMSFDGNRIVVQGISMNDTYWIGLGEVQGSQGYFDWRFDDGRYGQTTFKIDKNGNLDASSISYTVDYKYLAKKRTN
jgi:hypothetical protein